MTTYPVDLGNISLILYMENNISFSQKCSSKKGVLNITELLVVLWL